MIVFWVLWKCMKCKNSKSVNSMIILEDIYAYLIGNRKKSWLGA